MQRLRGLFTVCGVIMQHLHSVVAECETTMQRLRGLFTVCGVTMQHLLGLFTVSEMTMQPLHSLFGVCDFGSHAWGSVWQAFLSGFAGI